MRVLRTSVFPSMHDVPTHIIVRESDVSLPLEEAATVMSAPADVLIVTEIFEMEDGDLEPAVAEASRRAVIAMDDEMNMAVLYHWTAGLWHVIQDKGTIAIKDPSPISAEQIAHVFTQLSLHSDYRSFEFVSWSKDGRYVEFRDGEAKIRGDIRG